MNVAQAMKHSMIIAAAATLVSQSGLVAAQEKVTFNMGWLPQGSSIGPIVAQERGWYREAGLDVNIVRGYGGNRTANELDQGQFEFGYVDPISIVFTASSSEITFTGNRPSATQPTANQTSATRSSVPASLAYARLASRGRPRKITP